MYSMCILLICAKHRQAGQASFSQPKTCTCRCGLISPRLCTKSPKLQGFDLCSWPYPRGKHMFCKQASCCPGSGLPPGLTVTSAD